MYIQWLLLRDSSKFIQWFTRYVGNITNTHTNQDMVKTIITFLLTVFRCLCWRWADSPVDSRVTVHGSMGVVIFLGLHPCSQKEEDILCEVMRTALCDFPNMQASTLLKAHTLKHLIILCLLPSCPCSSSSSRLNREQHQLTYGVLPVNSDPNLLWIVLSNILCT